jgi:hypothetical protein
MPNRFKSFDNSVPGPWVAGGCGDSDCAGQARAEPQKKSSTPQIVQRFVAGSHWQSAIMPGHH